MSELLPCPHCPESQVACVFDDVSQRCRVYCGACGASSGAHPRDKTAAPAIAAWNRRTPPIVGEDARDHLRMDWLEANSASFTKWIGEPDGHTWSLSFDSPLDNEHDIRHAIDAAMKEGK